MTSIIYKKTREVLKHYALYECLGLRFIISAPPDYVDGEPFDVVRVDMTRGGGPVIVHVKNQDSHPLPKFNVPHRESKFSKRGGKNETR